MLENEQIILIEIVGIPYAGKTTLVRELSSALNKAQIVHQNIEEYGRLSKNNFFEAAKFTTDVTLVRALNTWKEIIELSYVRGMKVIIVDRGIADSAVWLTWFENGGIQCKEENKLIKLGLDSIARRCKRYFVVWLKASPIACGVKPSSTGRFINLKTMTELDQCYKSKLPLLSGITQVLEISREELAASELAKIVLNKTKVIKNS